MTLLKNAKSTNGDDLFNHLNEVFNKLILHFPTQAYDKLEEVSYLLKHKARLNTGDFLVLEEISSYNTLAEILDSYLSKLIVHFKVLTFKSVTIVLESLT
jgi:hypothetical protein